MDTTTPTGRAIRAASIFTVAALVIGIIAAIVLIQRVPTPPQPSNDRVERTDRIYRVPADIESLKWVVVTTDPPIRCMRLHVTEISGSGALLSWRDGSGQRVYLTGHYIAVSVISDSWEGALATAGLTLEECLRLERDATLYFRQSFRPGSP